MTLLACFQMLKHHVFDGKIIGERQSSVGVNGQRPVHGFVITVLKEVTETVGRMHEVGEKE